jgi:hypothetical protein
MFFLGILCFLVVACATSLPGAKEVQPELIPELSTLPAELSNGRPLRKVHRTLDIDEFNEVQKRTERWFLKFDISVTDLAKNTQIKYIKKLAEAASLGEILYLYAKSEDRRKVIFNHLSNILKQTSTAEYHKVMMKNSDAQFSENSMSYFRVLRVIESVGLDTTLYRAAMKMVLPRMYTHFKDRGPWQKIIFANYLDHFGLKRPAILEHEALKAAADPKLLIISMRVPANEIVKDVLTTYRLTHEVFL